MKRLSITISDEAFQKITELKQQHPQEYRTLSQAIDICIIKGSKSLSQHFSELLNREL